MQKFLKLITMLCKLQNTIRMEDSSIALNVIIILNSFFFLMSHLFFFFYLLKPCGHFHPADVLSQRQCNTL